MPKNHTNLTDAQKQLLEDLYQQTDLSVDDLPYTEEMTRIHEEFVQQTNLPLSVRDVYKALKNMGRVGRFGGKLRSATASAT